MHKIPRIHIDMNLPCPQCHMPGATFINGQPCKCFKCAIDDLKMGRKKAVNHLPPFWMCPPQINELAARLIDDHHPEAVNAKVCYLFRKKHNKANGKINLGKCHKVSEKDKTLHGFDYVIILAWDMWMMLSPTQQEALLLHELLHVFKDGEEAAAWKIQPHDVEEFGKVVDIYGLWKPDLEAFAASIYAANLGNRSGFEQMTFAGRRPSEEAHTTTH